MNKVFLVILWVPLFVIKNIKKNVKERLVRVIFWNIFREQMHICFETVFEWPNEIPTSPKKKKTSLQNFKKLKCKYRPVSKITLEEIYQRCDFKWHTRKHTTSCIIYTNLNKFLDEKFVVYKLPFPHSIKYIHLRGQKIFYRAKWRTGFGKTRSWL